MKEGPGLYDMLSSVIGEYLELKTDGIRRKSLTGLSVALGRALCILIMAMLLMLILFVVSIALTVIIGNAAGGWGNGALIVAGLYMFIFLIVFLLRKRLFVNMFANLFGAMEDEDSDSGQQWKPVLLALVRYIRSRLDDTAE